MATYSYYYNGLRRSKTVGGVTTYFHWDAFGNLASQNDTSGNSLDFYYDPRGNIIGLVRNGDPNQKYIYHTNLRGDIVTVTDSANTIQAQYSYDPWGTQTSYSGTITQPLRYAGYYYDDETGLYYLKSRYYSPEAGRFTTKDGYSYVRYGDSKTLNLYNYCGGNPMNAVDPNGNDYVGEATVSGVVVDANEYEYLSNMAENDADAGNRVWAQALLDQYDAATYDPFNPSDVLSSCLTSFITSCNDPVTVPAIENTLAAYAITTPVVGQLAYIKWGSDAADIIEIGQTAAGLASSSNGYEFASNFTPSKLMQLWSRFRN